MPNVIMQSMNHINLLFQKVTDTDSQTTAKGAAKAKSTNPLPFWRFQILFEESGLCSPLQISVPVVILRNPSTTDPDCLANGSGSTLLVWLGFPLRVLMTLTLSLFTLIIGQYIVFTIPFWLARVDPRSWLCLPMLNSTAKDTRVAFVLPPIFPTWLNFMAHF